MSYPAVPSGDRLPWDIDGTSAGYNESGYGNANTAFTAAQANTLNTENNAGVVITSGPYTSIFVTFVFAEPKDIDAILSALYFNGPLSDTTALPTVSLYGSTDTTSGLDGTWNAITVGSGTLSVIDPPTSWWRANQPASLTANNTGLTGLRVEIVNQYGYTAGLIGLHLYGDKSAGATPNDLVFFSDSAATQPITSVEDFGNVPAGSGAQDLVMYLQNTSTTLTAQNVALSFGGPGASQFQVGINGTAGTFNSTANVAAIAPQAIQEIVVQLVPPAYSVPVLGPNAAYLAVEPQTF